MHSAVVSISRKIHLTFIEFAERREGEAVYVT